MGRAILFLVLAAVGLGQDFTHFEVASVRPADPFPDSAGVPVYFPQGGIGTDDPGHIAYRGVWLFNLIEEAYQVRNFQLSAPAWLGQARYDVVATIPAGATKAQFNVMLQNLLRERFHLESHLESKILPVYVLTVGKNGSKLKESAKVSADALASGTKAGADEQGFPTLPANFSGSRAIPSAGRLRVSAQRVKIDSLLGTLGQQLDRPVVDQTGLTGEYDFKLEMEWRSRPGTAPADTADPAPTVFSAVEKLGLKLEPAKVPFDVLVVDRLDRVPTEN